MIAMFKGWAHRYPEQAFLLFFNSGVFVWLRLAGSAISNKLALGWDHAYSSDLVDCVHGLDLSATLYQGLGQTPAFSPDCGSGSLSGLSSSDHFGAAPRVKIN